MPLVLRRVAVVSASQAQPLRPVHRGNAGPHLSHPVPGNRPDALRSNTAHRSADNSTSAEPSTSGRPSPAALPLQQRLPRRQPAFGDELSMSGALSRPASVGRSIEEATPQHGRRTARVRFWLKFRTEFGQSVRVVGSHEQLGSWSLTSAPALRWSDGDLWNATIDLPAGGVFEYKYAVVSGDGRTASAWQRGNNSVIAIRQDDTELEVFDNWEGNPGAAVVAGGTSTTREGRLLKEMEAILTAQRNELRETRMQLFEAQEEARSARQDAVQLRTDLIMATQARLEAERKLSTVEVENSQLRMELSRKSHEFKLALEECKRLLGGLDEVTADSPAAELPEAPPSVNKSSSSMVPRKATPVFQSAPPAAEPSKPAPAPHKLPFANLFPGKVQPPFSGATPRQRVTATPPSGPKFANQPHGVRPGPVNAPPRGGDANGQTLKPPTQQLIQV